MRFRYRIVLMTSRIFAVRGRPPYLLGGRCAFTALHNHTPGFEAGEWFESLDMRKVAGDGLLVAQPRGHHHPGRAVAVSPRGDIPAEEGEGTSSEPRSPPRQRRPTRSPS